jgi:transcriptional regulator with XRE-family HTH domain
VHWAPERFRAVLAELQDKSGLSDAEIGDLAGKSRSQVNRWSRAENQPSFDGLNNLARALRAKGYSPELVALGEELLQAAGYTTPAEELAQRPRFTVIVNEDDPEPDQPPGGFRNKTEKMIWLMDDYPWQVRLEQILVARQYEDARESQIAAESAANDHE